MAAGTGQTGAGLPSGCIVAGVRSSEEALVADRRQLGAAEQIPRVAVVWVQH